MININKLADKYFDEMVQHRRFFHENPELSFEENKTVAYILKELDSLGIQYTYPMGKNGIMAWIEGSTPGKTIAFRGDMDALPIQEDTDLSFASKTPDVMHACGHDAHTALILTLAKSMKAHEDELKGKAVFFFQHAEEKSPGGAIQMIADGALEGVDAVYGAHVSNYEKVGAVGALAGISHGTDVNFKVDIYGVAGHSSAPVGTVDTNLIASQGIVLIHNILDRYTNPFEPATINIGSIHGGSTANNIICDHTHFSGMLRAAEIEVGKRLIEQIEKTIKHVTQMADATYEIEVVFGYPPVDNWEESVEKIKEAARMVDVPFIESIRGLGGEDFAYFIQDVPGCIIRIYSGPREDVEIFPAHHPKFMIEEESMKAGFKVFWQVFKNENDMA